MRAKLFLRSHTSEGWPWSSSSHTSDFRLSPASCSTGMILGKVLETNFGPYDLEGEAEAELDALRMKDNQKLTKYLVEFNWITARLQWGNAAFRHAFYRRLPSRV